MLWLRIKDWYRKLLIKLGIIKVIPKFKNEKEIKRLSYLKKNENDI